MKIKCDMILDTESGEYELKFNNLSNPGEGIDYFLLMAMIRKVFLDVNEQIDGTGIESTDQIIKLIN